MATPLASAVHPALAPAQDRYALREVFAHLHADSCPRHFNFHMHTLHSDGQLRPEDLAQQAIDIGLKGFAITDHHSVAGYRVAQDYLERYREQVGEHRAMALPHLWTGIEINAELLGVEVHILAYAFDPDASSLQPYMQQESVTGEAFQAHSVIRAIHQAGGLAVLAHPDRYRQPIEAVIPAAADLGIDGVEAFYAYNNPDPWRPSPKQTEQALALSRAYQLLNTCGTDTHGLNLLQRL